jgi:hypothetical protein
LEDVVGITGKDSAGVDVAFMAWGRLFDAVEEANLLETVRVHSPKYVSGPINSLKLCDSLAQVSSYKYFYEALLHFAWEPIPFGDKYEAWRDSRGKASIFLARCCTEPPESNQSNQLYRKRKTDSIPGSGVIPTPPASGPAPHLPDATRVVWAS